MNVINFANQNFLILQLNWLYIKRKSLCQQNNVNLAYFIAIHFDFWITESKKCYMKKNIQWKTFYQCAKITKVYNTT